MDIDIAKYPAGFISYFALAINAKSPINRLVEFQAILLGAERRENLAKLGKFSINLQ